MTPYSSSSATRRGSARVSSTTSSSVNSAPPPVTETLARRRGRAPAVDVGAVERAEVVEVVLVAAAHDQGVVARDRHVVEEHVGVRPAADRHALALQREALAHAAAPGPHDQRGALADDVLDLDGH